MTDKLLIEALERISRIDAVNLSSLQDAVDRIGAAGGIALAALSRHRSQKCHKCNGDGITHAEFCPLYDREREIKAVQDYRSQQEARKPLTDEPTVIHATIRDGGDELHIECRFSDGQKFAAITIDSGFPGLAQRIVAALSASQLAPPALPSEPEGSPDWSAIGFAAPTPSKGEA